MSAPLSPVEAITRDLRWIADMSAKLNTVPLDTVMIPLRNLAYMYRTCAAALELAKADAEFEANMANEPKWDIHNLKSGGPWSLWRDRLATLRQDVLNARAKLYEALQR